MESNKLHVIHANHPRNQELFHMIATPPERLKANRSTVQTQCSTCFTTRHKLQTCQRCKSVYYCSKECQKKNWPYHKTLCTPADRPKGIQKLAEYLICNTILNGMLQLAAALDLDLPNDEKKEIGFKFPFMIRADIGIEPSDIFDFVTLLFTDEPVSNKMEGMVQVNHFHSHIPGQSGHVPLTKARDSMWRSVREKLDNDPSDRVQPLGLIEFVNDSDFSITVPLPIHPIAIKAAREKEPFVGVSSVTGATVEDPMSVHACMESINSHIRSDKQNQLKLRTEMTDKDKSIVRGARDKSSTRKAVVLLRHKMARETIYANMPLN